jgi:hypothetical protein
MRALCGAIISAGALIGLGLSAIGIGTRYDYPYLDDNGHPQFIEFKRIDTALMVIILACLITLAIGLGITFVGLALHHHRRLLEWQHRLGRRPEQPPPGSTPPGPSPPGEPRPSERVSV